MTWIALFLAAGVLALWLTRQNTLSLPGGRFVVLTVLPKGLPASDSGYINQRKPPYRHGRGQYRKLCWRVYIGWGQWWKTEAETPGYRSGEKPEVELQQFLPDPLEEIAETV